MRLKGGKVLLDLTSYDITQDAYYTLTKEEFKAVLEKGVSVLLNINNEKILITPVINDIANLYISYNGIIVNGDQYDVGIQWNSETTQFFISVQ